MNQIRTKKEQQIEWRRSKVQELVIKGYSQSEIARTLNIPKVTICRDVSYLKDKAEETIKYHIQKTLPYEYSNCLQGLHEIIKEVWIILENADKTGERLQSLALIKEIFVTRMDLLTNASLLQDSIKFVEQIKDKLSNNNKKEVNKQDNGMEGFTETDWTAESTDTVF